MVLENIRDVRGYSGLSQVEFSKKYGIPVDTLKGWESMSEIRKRPCPEYVLKLLERVVKEDFPR